MAGACQAPSQSDTIPHLCLSTLLQDRRKTLSKHTPHSSGTSHMRLPQSCLAVICRHAPRQEARCTALHVATQRAATAGAACCVGHRSAVHFQGRNYAPARRAHRGSLFTRPNMCRNASPLPQKTAQRGSKGYSPAPRRHSYCSIAAECRLLHLMLLLLWQQQIEQ